MKKIISGLIIIIFTGWVGLGLDKRTTLVPDEVWLYSDFNPDSHYNISEATCGFKWKLK